MKKSSWCYTTSKFSLYIFPQCCVGISLGHSLTHRWWCKSSLVTFAILFMLFILLLCCLPLNGSTSLFPVILMFFKRELSRNCGALWIVVLCALWVRNIALCRTSTFSLVNCLSSLLSMRAAIKMSPIKIQAPAMGTAITAARNHTAWSLTAS